VVDFVSAAPVLREEREFEMQRDPQAIGLFGSYLLLDGESVAMKQGEGPGILLVDLLAALERITFDRALLGEVEKQGLLLPETFSVSVEEVQLLEAHRECIEKAGISVRAFGKQSVLVDAIPSFMEISDTAQALSYIVEVLQEGGDPTFDQLRQKRLAQVICRFVRAHKKHFVLQEALGIFRQLMETSAPHQCPQGKPTMHHLTTYEIKRFFKATE
jgi:DNA mismatch repair protein MutL